MKTPIIIRNSPIKPHVPGNPIFPNKKKKKEVANNGIKYISHYNNIKDASDIYHIKILHTKINTRNKPMT